MRQKMQQQQQQPQQQQQHQGQQSQLRSQYPVISIDEFEQFMSSRQQQQQQYSTHPSIAKEYTVISPPAAGFQFQTEKQQAQGQSHHYPSNLTHTKHNTLVTLNALKAKNKNLFTIEDLGQEDHVPSKNNLQGKQQYQHQQLSMNSNTGGGVSRSYQSNQSNKQISCYSNNRQTQSKSNSWNSNNNNYSSKAQKLQQQSQVASNKDGINIKGTYQRQSQPKSQTSQNNLWYGQSDRDKENDDPQIISAQRDQTAVVKSQSQYLHRNTNSCHDVVVPEYSFNPMLSKKSMKMAENMENAYVRLSVSSLLKKQANIQAMRDNIEGQCKFKPTVNSNYKKNKKKEQIEGKQNNEENQKDNSYGDNEGVDEEDAMISSILTDSLEIDQDTNLDRAQGEDGYQQGSHDKRNTFQSAFFRDSQHGSEQQLVNDQQIKQISVSSLEENNSTNRIQSENDNINTQQQPQHRWERLYKQHEVILAKRAIEAARSKEAIDAAGLTFKPNLKATKNISRQSQQTGEDNDDDNNNRHSSNYPMDIAQRSEIWLNKKQAKIDTAVAEAQVNALRHCTFAPVTISNNHKQQQNQIHQQLRTNSNRQALGRINREGEQGIGLTDRDSQNGNEQYGEENNSLGEHRDQQLHYQSKQPIMSNESLPFPSSNTDNTNYQSTAQFSSNSPSSQLSSARDTLEYITDFNRRGLEQYFQRVEAAKNKRLLKQQQSQMSLTSGIASKRITVPKEFSFMKQNRQHSQDEHVSQRGNAQLSAGIAQQIQQQQPKQKGYQQQMMKIRSVSCNQLQTLHKQLRM